MQDVAKRYAVWIAASVILLLAAIGGYLYWRTPSRYRVERSFGSS